MDWYIKLVILYLIVINSVAVIVTVYDKIAAQRNKQRISERSLIIISLLGGSFLMYLTMKSIRHKTLHPKFMIGIPIIIILQILLTLAVCYLV